MIRFLSTDEVLYLHDRILERFGGEAGVRDAGQLECALYRPRTGHYPDLAAMATALFESIVLTRPFEAANRATAFFSMDTFVRLNGWKLSVEPRAAYRVLTTLEENEECDFTHLLPAIRNSLVRL